MADDPDFLEALEAALTPLTTARSLFSILERAEREGVLDALRDGRSVAHVAEQVHLPEDRVRAVCAALTANGVAETDSGRVRLTPAWRALTADDAFATLRDLLAHSRAVDVLLSAPDATYENVSADVRSTFARSVSPNSYSPHVVARVRADIAADPWFAAMREGGRYLELGCGIAGRMLTMLQAMPGLTAVGVELDAHLAHEARGRAVDLGVAHRVEIVTGDATTYRADEPFDFGFWSQWFFPARTRSAALTSLRENLRSGAVVRSPVFGEHERMAADPQGIEARRYALDRVMLASWGVPERTPDQLAAEISAAGFTDAAAVRTDLATSVYARRP